MITEYTSTSGTVGYCCAISSAVAPVSNASTTQSVTSIVRQKPGALPVVLAVPVAGATRQVRLPQPTGWDEGIEAVLRREVSPQLRVERRPEATLPSVSSGA